MPTTIEYARTGKLRLAVTTATRSSALADIPTVGDFVPSYEASSWHGVGVPKKNTPAEIVEKLNKEINAGLTSLRSRDRRHRERYGTGAPNRYHADTATCGIN